jgi:Putative zinc-finger
MSVTLCCRDATALLTEDAEGALSGIDQASFSMHLAICVQCRRYRSQLHAAVEVLKAIPREAPKPDDVEAVLRMLAEAPAPDDDDP